jgi:hypothetical protein
VGETCGMRLIYTTIGLPEKCAICVKIERKQRRLSRCMSNLQRWREEQIERKASIAVTWQEAAILSRDIALRYPDASSPAIPGVPVYANGLRCVFEVEGRECNYTCRKRSGIQKHCKTHGYNNPRRKGRPNEDTDHSRLWVENQTCQWFFHTGKCQKIFPIQVVPRPGQAATVDIITKANE